MEYMIDPSTEAYMILIMLFFPSQSVKTSSWKILFHDLRVSSRLLTNYAKHLAQRQCTKPYERFRHPLRYYTVRSSHLICRMLRQARSFMENLRRLPFFHGILTSYVRTHDKNVIHVQHEEDEISLYRSLR